MQDNFDSRLIKMCLISSITVAVIVFLLKAYALIFTGSVSILASLIDSGLDLSVSVMNYLAIKYSLEPPDDRHRFGHDKIQDIAIFVQSIFFFISGIFTIFSAGKNMIYNHEITNTRTGVLVMFISIALTLSLLVFQSYVVRKTNSNIIKADKLHYFTDLCTNIAVIFGVYFGKDYLMIDIGFGSLISLYIIYGAYKLVKLSIKNLIDEEFGNEEKEILLKIIRNYTEVRGVHDLKTRKAGDKSFIQFHIELDGNISLYKSHEIAEKIMYEISNIFINTEIIIHQDPEGIEENVQYRESL
jgi:ferrous-iron efflux pump FieF